MPFTLALTHRSRRQVQVLARHEQSPSTVIETVTAAALPAFVTLWLGVFRDLREALPRAALEDALDAPQVLDTYTLLDQTWWVHGDGPARAMLMPLAFDVVAQAGEAMLPAISTLVEQSVAFQAGLPEVEQAVRTAVGQQVQAIGQTTLRTVRGVVWDGWQADVAAAPLARAVRAAFGLTPRQQRGLQAMRTRLLAQGTPGGQVATALATARQQALRTRAETIAATQTWTLGQMAQRLVVEQAARSGAVTAPQMRRYWRVAGGERTCVRCLAIPGLNPGGVGLHEPFRTPGGTIMEPTLHANCRCHVEYRVGA
jgi:hypothetical protein